MTTRDKIRYAKIYDDALHKMAEIFKSKDVQKAIRKLEDCGDEDLDECEGVNSTFTDISMFIGNCLRHTDFSKFIKKKEEELKNGTEGHNNLDSLLLEMTSKR